MAELQTLLPGWRKLLWDNDAPLHCWEEGPKDPDDGMATACQKFRRHTGAHSFQRLDWICRRRPNPIPDKP